MKSCEIIGYSTYLRLVEITALHAATGFWLVRLGHVHADDFPNLDEVPASTWIRKKVFHSVSGQSGHPGGHRMSP